eukprot:4194610-Heterocapsa_arctica.AAC.1
MKEIYCTVNGIKQFMTKFRPDAHYAIKEIGRTNREPTEASLRKMKRCVRYLSGTPDLGMMFKKDDGKIDTMKITSDSDWAKGGADRK